MINAPQLLADLTRLLKRLEDDLRQRIAEVAVLKAGLQAEWQAARDADRTAETFESWADQVITQAGVHWLLSCVFLRFIEDNELVERPWLGGTPESGRLALARDRHEAYFREKPLESDRDYLLACFREAGTLPGLHTFFDEAHNPVFRLGISGDAAMALRQFWQQVDPNTGTLAHDFTDADWNTRFLGDLYQDLSEATRKRYALLQTPEFVEEFILDRTLTPAIREFGFREVRMIDPTCGSGHFLLGGFRRLVDEWVRNEPARNPRDIAQRALDAVAGVDLNPFAVAISRFRLLVAALKVSGVHRLTEAPDFKLNVAIGDSLLHGKRFGMTATDGMFEGAEHYAGTGLAHAYASEDLAEVQRILGRQYHAVVGNPPYIIVKDQALNAAYRKQYASCHGKYSLGCPFTERLFELAHTGTSRHGAGFVGLITTNAFMKRKFGVALIEHVLPRLDLTHILDTSRAHIPEHGTPTVILLGRHRAPVAETVRAVMGIRGEAVRPSFPSQAPVWLAITSLVDSVGSASEYVSVADISRERLSHHPWSISGGGTADLKAVITEAAPPLSKIASVGIGAVTLEDEAYLIDRSSAHRRRIPPEFLTIFVVGDEIREWSAGDARMALIPHQGEAFTPVLHDSCLPWLWLFRTNLSNRLWFKKTQLQRGMKWFEYGHISADKFKTPLAIAVAFLSTHNECAFLRNRWICNRTAPMVKLHVEPTEARYKGLLGVMNSSVACFWLKHTLMDRGGGGIGGGLATETWEKFFEHDGGKLEGLPVTESLPVDLSERLVAAAESRSGQRPFAVLSRVGVSNSAADLAANLQSAKERDQELREQMIAMQEEIDWRCYVLYGLLPSTHAQVTSPLRAVPKVRLGERAFEIVLARRMAAGLETTAWFERHGSSPITEIPAHWPEDYSRVVQWRIELIESDHSIGLIERPEYKRRWNTPTWDNLARVALRDWLLDWLEAPHLWPAGVDRPPQLTTVNRLVDAVRADTKFMQIAELYAGHSGFDVTQVVAELVAGESVPFLPVLRYTDTGLRKRAQWEDTWALQRREDAGEKVGKIPVPPKYQSKDFLKVDFWRLRGGLDVPKERWVSYPGCERGADTSLAIAWAGWNHLQQATALAAYYLEMKENEGWEPARLQPLLAGLLELIPWLEQWHNEIDPAYGERMGTYYRGFVNEEARALGFTLDDLRSWKPAVAPARRGRRRTA